MAVTQIYTAIAGDTISAARWNNEFGNIYNNPSTYFSGITVTVSTQSAVIASGSISVTDDKTRVIIVDTESAAASDNLDTLLAVFDYQIVTLHTLDSSRDVVVRHNQGNILLTGAANFTLSNVADTLSLMYNPIAVKWVEIGRGDNA